MMMSHWHVSGGLLMTSRADVMQTGVVIRELVERARVSVCVCACVCARVFFVVREGRKYALVSPAASCLVLVREGDAECDVSPGHRALLSKPCQNKECFWSMCFSPGPLSCHASVTKEMKVHSIKSWTHTHTHTQITTYNF